MKLRLYSDLHTEFEAFDMPEVPDEKDTVLLLAGDIGVARRNNTLHVLPEWCERHKAVVYVPGNHEYYGGALPAAWQDITEGYGWTPNLHLLNPGEVMIDGVMFIGATLWTDMDSRTMQIAGVCMNDYRVIRKREIRSDEDKGKLRPIDTVGLHYEHKNFIFDRLGLATHMGCTSVVVTHHAPSPQSVATKYVGDELNGAYYTDLEEEIIKHDPTLWVHGHVHSGFDYHVGRTRVIANPRGYPQKGGGLENQDFIKDGRLDMQIYSCLTTEPLPDPTTNLGEGCE